MSMVIIYVYLPAKADWEHLARGHRRSKGVDERDMAV